MLSSQANMQWTCSLTTDCSSWSNVWAAAVSMQRKGENKDKVFFYFLYLEANERDLHGEDGSQAVDGAVGHVDTVGEAASEHEDQHVEGDEVDQEHIATPGGHLQTDIRVVFIWFNVFAI